MATDLLWPTIRVKFVKRASRTVVAISLTGVFVALGAGVLCDLAARILPVYVERATILGRDMHQTILADLATRTRTFASVYRIVLADKDGNRFTIDAPRELYDRAVPGLMMMAGMTVNIRRSVLFDKPIELEITERPLVNLGEFPALGRLLDAQRNDAQSRVSTYDLRLAYVLSFGGLAMVGLLAWVMINLPRKEEIIWPLFGSGMVVSAALGTWWWAV